MSAATARKTSKRPSAEERRESILDAAGKVFFEQGFSGASVDSMIEIVGGSKRTIYAEFGNKEGLFTALVNRSADNAIGDLAGDLSESRDIRETMIRFGKRLLETYQTEDLMGIYRIILLEAERFPDLARTVYEKGAGRASKNLADALKRAKSQGDISVADVTAVANHFVGMMRGNEYLRVVLGLRGKIAGGEADAFVKSAVDLCMYGMVAPDKARRAHNRSR
jgi:AcrR family transcriptional regulator